MTDQSAELARLTSQLDMAREALARNRAALDLIDPMRPLQYATTMDLMRRVMDAALAQITPGAEGPQDTDPDPEWIPGTDPRITPEVVIAALDAFALVGEVEYHPNTPPMMAAMGAGILAALTAIDAQRTRTTI